ncbi:hypothetical protein NQZ68_027189 [Dissostichus eleginoides]|nr:hypothetical protein NQZ68_027189 [Dissostichus eleginoides]
MRASGLGSSALSKDFTMSLQAIIQIRLTKMKASGTCDDSVQLSKPSQNFADLAKNQPKTCSKAFHHTSAPPSHAKLGKDDNDPTGSHSALPL